MHRKFILLVFFFFTLKYVSVYPSLKDLPTEINILDIFERYIFGILVAIHFSMICARLMKEVLLDQGKKRSGYKRLAKKKKNTKKKSS